MKITILGQGAWGRALGELAKANGHAVGFVRHLDREWPEKSELIISAIPVQHIRETAGHFAAPECPVLNAAKGLEIGTGMRVSEIMDSVWGNTVVGILSGPTLAEEVSRGLPAAAVVAHGDEAVAKLFQEALHQPRFRLYRSTDLAGVEMGGALKNVYALAGGVSEGLRLGENARAALLTRSLAEMTRIGGVRGGRAETFFGLSGAGDLFLTATSHGSRNFRVGYALAQGASLEDAMQSAGGVVEGVMTAKALVEDVSLEVHSKPVAVAVHAMLYEGKSPGEMVESLMSRAAKSEV